MININECLLSEVPGTVSSAGHEAVNWTEFPVSCNLDPVKEEVLWAVKLISIWWNVSVHA